MSDQENAGQSAGDENLLPAEGQQPENTAQTEIDAPEVNDDAPADNQPEGEEAKKRESARERRERDKAYKQRLRDEAEKARQDARAAQQKLEQIRTAGQQEQPPKEADFEDYTDYVAAKAIWAADQKAAKREADTAAQQADTARQRAQAIEQEQRKLVAQNWQQQAQEAASRITDFAQVVTAPGLFPEGAPMVDLIMESDVAADLAYTVASDRALHDRLLAMTPTEAARELGRIEARLSAPPPLIETKAPAPITPTRAQARVAVDPLKMTADQYEAWRASGGTF